MAFRQCVEMSRRHNFVSTMAAMQRAADQAAQARLRTARELERLQRQQERARIADQKEQIRLFQEQQRDEVVAPNQALGEKLEELNNILRNSVGPTIACRSKS